MNVRHGGAEPGVVLPPNRARSEEKLCHGRVGGIFRRLHVCNLQVAMGSATRRGEADDKARDV